MSYIFSGLLSLIVPIFVIGAIVYLIAHRRNGSNGITAHQALITYFHVITGASIITLAVGAAILLSVMFSQLYGGREIADDMVLGSTLLGTGLIICIFCKMCHQFSNSFLNSFFLFIYLSKIFPQSTAMLFIINHLDPYFLF